MLKKLINYFKIYSKLYTLEPVSRKFGFDRGLPIDRFYIEKFLDRNKKYIEGVVLEMGENTYTKKFGGYKVKDSLIINFIKDKKADLVGDLATGKGIPKEKADCFILTQTLPFIYDVKSAIKNSLKVLKHKGVLLVTIPGITQISRYDMDRWGHYWSFTNLSLQKMFEEFIPKKNIQIETYGNVKAASLFLYGLATEEVSKKDLEYRDEDYQLLISAVVKKP